ncbi:hypothetical protein Tco_0592880 [Tanacetum coccineum]
MASSEIGLAKSCRACSIPSVFLTADVGWLSKVCSLVLMVSILGNAVVFRSHRWRQLVSTKCGLRRGSPSTDDLRRRPKPARVRLAMPGSCQCDLGLSLGPLICLVGPEPIVAIRPRPKGLMDLFTFIRHSDPTKVRVGERNLADREVKLLKMTEGRTVTLDPPATAALGGSGDSIDKLFNEEHDAGQKHSVEKDDDALEEKLRDDHQSLPPNTSGKSLATLRGMISEGSDLPCSTMDPLIIASKAPIPDAVPVNFVSGLNLRTRPPHVRYVVSSDSSYHSDSYSYSEATSFARSLVADALVVTVVVTTIVDADVAAGSKVRDTPKDFEDIRDSASAGRVCLGAAEVRMRAEHTLEKKVSEAAEAISLRNQLSVVEAADAAKSTELRDLMEKNFALEGERNSLSEKVTTLESVTTSKEDELASLSSQVAKLIADLSGLQLSRDELNSKVASLESERDCLASQITIAGQRWILNRGLKFVLAKCLSSHEYLSAMGEAIGRSIDKGMQDGMALGIEHGRAERSIEDVAAFNPSAEGDYVAAINALQGVSFSLLSQLEAHKDSSMADVMDLLRLEGDEGANLTADLSGFQLSRDELNSKVASLESERDCLASQKSSLEFAFELFKEQVEKMQDEQVGVLSERVAAIDSDLMEMVLHMDAEFYPRYLTTIAGRRWILSRGLKLVLAKCLSSPEYLSAMGEAIGRSIDKGMQDGLAAGIEHGRAGRSIEDVAAFNPSAEGDYVAAINVLQGVSFSLIAQLEAHKDSSMADVMDLLRLEGPATETSEASQLQPSPDQLMIPIHRLEDQVIIGETSLAFSLEVAHNRVQRVRGDAAARRLSLTDSILPLVEPLSARNLTGEVSPSVDFTTAVTTALSTTFAQTNPAPTVLSTEVPPSPKIIFEEEELDTTPEHVPAP